MKLLCLNPPFKTNHGRFSRTSRSPAITKSGTIYYPIWLCYVAGVLEDVGHEIKIIDSCACEYDLEKTLQLIADFRPEMAVLDTSTPSIYDDVKTGIEIKKILPDCFVVLMGTHPSALPEEVLQLNDLIDAIAVGEADYTVRELTQKLSGADLHKVQIDFTYRDNILNTIDGLAYRNGDRININKSREFIKNLDELPFVSRVYKKHLLNCIDKYFYGANLHPVITILSGRGCPHQCIYCLYPQTMTGNKYRYRSIENVVDELEYIKSEFPHVKEVFLEDDTLTVNSKRAQALADEILERGLKIIWSTNSRADVDYETLRKIKESGCRLLCVGFESGDQMILDNINKNLKVEKIYQFMKDAKKARLLIHGCFLFGSPGETRKTMAKTLKIAKKIKPDTAQFFPIMVYPGTKAYNWAKEKGYLATNNFSEWLTETGLHNCVVSRQELSNRELVEFCDKARREFYLRPSYLFSKAKQIIIHPKEAKRIFRASKTLLKYLFSGSFLSSRRKMA